MMTETLEESEVQTASKMLPLLTIVIPALNEEESIGSTVNRCLAARDHIRTEGKVRDIEVIVVNDGSTDRTSEIAHAIADQESTVKVIDFPLNRGYGAAIKEGFDQGAGELVSFLDADGTCDPNYFAEMCRSIQDESAAVVLGSRMGKDSEMPKVRRLGNRIFALLLGVLSGKAVTDTASGMRVMQRQSLERLYPLPDGLQFTPAMSARALMDDQKILEMEMTYSERVGESKLHVLKDGVRFLIAILSALLVFRPSRIFNTGAAVSAIVAIGWGLYPLEFYVREGRLEEGMIYRVLLCTFLMTCAFVFLAAGVLANQILALVHRKSSRGFVEQILEKGFSPKCLGIWVTISIIASLVIIAPGLIEYFNTGETSLHWSRAIVAIFLLQTALVSVVFAILQGVVQLWRFQMRREGGRA